MNHILSTLTKRVNKITKNKSIMENPWAFKSQRTRIQGSFLSHTHTQKKHAASTLGEDFLVLTSGMDTVASAILQCGSRVYTKAELFEEVITVEGLDEDKQLVAYDYRCEDAIQGRTLVGLPISQRK